MAQNLRKPHVPICARKKVFSIFNTKEVTVEKQIIWPFWLIYRKIHLMCKRSHLTMISETSSSHLNNAVCDMLHQYTDKW